MLDCGSFSKDVASRLNGALVAISKQQVHIHTTGISDLKNCRELPVENAGSVGNRIPIICDIPLEGRYVTIYIPMEGILTLCEVQVQLLKGKSLLLILLSCNHAVIHICIAWYLNRCRTCR